MGLEETSATEACPNPVPRRLHTPQVSSTNGTYKAKQTAATLGAGIQDGELFKAMADKNLIAVGGTNYDVGVVGWATGGGHGLATGHYGMGADNIIEAVLITPSEEVLTANEYQNSDIFWAIRGHGGGTFGIICSVTAPLLDLLSASNDTIAYTASPLWFSSWYSLFTPLPAVEHVGTTKAITASRLISRRTVTENKALFAQTLEEVGPKAVTSLNGAPNFSLSSTLTISTKHVNNALNPASRETAVHLISSRSWDDSLEASTVNEIVEDMTYSKLNTLRLLDPGSGAYLNEANTC
ncbi:hypothetical protein F4677DRAFT_465998 [Hypoxylon crocopeplum]|nr:hypothetical protein F4677DRAFT_465998 [Hypoxylon crocopeplum]